MDNTVPVKLYIICSALMMRVANTMSSTFPTSNSSPCRKWCGNIALKYPFATEDGCGAPQFRHMLNCTPPDLFFETPSGSYKVQSIDYDKEQVLVYDPSMSTCSILQPHHDLILSGIQSAMIPPSFDTVFALLNCSIDSPVLNHYRNLCFNFSGHSCDELYTSCNAFRIFRLLTNSSPPCCFTNYDTLRFMSMNVLDCSHYTVVTNTDSLKGIGPLDWVYGIKLSYSVPDRGCGRCSLSGGTCGFDTDTEALQCLCSPSANATRDCADVGNIIASGYGRNTHDAGPWSLTGAFFLPLSVPATFVSLISLFIQLYCLPSLIP